MWACPRCGAEHPQLYDAYWNCSCAGKPLTPRLNPRQGLSALGSAGLRLALGPAVGAAWGCVLFLALGWPPAEGLQLGVLPGFAVGAVWAWSWLLSL